MFLSKLFTPKWQHKNPNVRKHALLSISNKTADRQIIYAAVAIDDPESSIRRIAVQRLLDLELLTQISKHDKDQNVSSDAGQRLAHILSGKLKSGPSLEARAEKIEAIVDEPILNYLLKNAAESAIRLSIAERFNQQSIYADVAITDPDNDVQLAALKHISQKALLERVAKKTRRKSQAVSQAAQSRVDNIREQDEAVLRYRQEAKLLCAEVSGLINDAREHKMWADAEIALERITSRWAELISQWDALSDSIDEELTLNFDRVCRAFINEKADYDAGQAKRQALNEKYIPIQQEKRKQCDQLELELSNIHTAKSLSNAEIDKLEKLGTSHKASWKALKKQFAEPLDKYDEALDQALNQQHDELMDKICAYQKDIKLYIKSIEIAKKLSRQASQLIKKPGHIKPKDIASLQEKWAALTKPVHFSLVSIDSIDIDAQIALLKSKYEAQEELSKQNKREFVKVMQLLKESVDDGQAANANKLVKQGGNLLRKLAVEDVKEFRESGSLQQFQLLQQEVGELQDWRKWSNEPKKIQLCQSMEKLLEEIPETAEPNFEDIAEQVRLARKEWKNLSKSEINASIELWERFDAACKKAYAPCQEYFSDVAIKRDENLLQRESLCRSLEDYCKVVMSKPNEQTDWRAADKIVRVASKDWGKLGPVNHKDKKAIDGRFHTILNNLNKHIREEKQYNSEKKTLIINRAEKIATDLVDERTTLNEAIATAKKLQVEWKTIGLALKDAVLWKAFRKPCDEIFGLRTSNIEEEKQLQQTLINERKEICENIESRASLSTSEIMSKRTEIRDLAQQWSDFERLARQDKLEIRYNKAMEAFGNQVKNAEIELGKALKLQRQEQVLMCLQVEDIVRNLFNRNKDIAQLEPDLAKLRQQWQSLEFKQDSYSRVIVERFQSGVQLFDDLKAGDNNELYAKIEVSSKIAKETKLALCLQLEIATNIDSPLEYQQDRMAYQVSMLADRMKHDFAYDMANESEELALSWHKAGIVIDGDARALENRFFDTYHKNC